MNSSPDSQADKPAEGGAQEKTAPTPPTPQTSSKGGLYWWLVLIILLGSGGYAYQSDWLDGPIDSLLGRTDATASTEAATPPAPAVVAVTTDLDEGMLAQIEALQSRIIELEGTTRQLSTINEELAELVVRQPQAGQAAAAPQGDLSQLQFEIIDLRLQLTGDTTRAVLELERLADTLDGRSPLLAVIEAERLRLSQLPTREQMLELHDRLQSQYSDARSNLERQLAEAEGTLTDGEQTIGAELMFSLFSVRRVDTQRRDTLMLLDTIGKRAEEARAAYLLGEQRSYLAALGLLQESVDALTAAAPSAAASQLAQTANRLVVHGFPASQLEIKAFASALNPDR